MKTKMDRLLQERRYSTAAVTSRSFAGLLFLLIAAAGSWAQPGDLRLMRSAVNNGHFEQVVTTAPAAIVQNRKAGAFATASEAEVFYARSLIQLERYEDAWKILEEALLDAERSKNFRTIATVYFVNAGLSRFERNFRDAIGHARKGHTSAPNDPQIKLEYYLAIGRILYSSGYDVAAIVWLEKAEGLSSELPMSSARLDVLGHLSFAWASKFNYAKAIEYGEKLVKAAEKTEYKYRYRLALFELGNLLSSVGQERKARALLEKGLDISLKAKDDYQSSLFLSTLILTSLYKGDILIAEKHLTMLERSDRNKRFRFESVLGKAVIASLTGQDDLAKQYFSEIASLKNHSDHIVPYWRLTIAEQKKDWKAMIEQGEILRKLSEEQNFRDDLPAIHLSVAKGYRGLGRPDIAFEHAKRSAAIFESDRPIGDAPLSLSLLETYHSVYRLLAEAEEERNDIPLALELADYLKGRVLRDRLEDSALRRRADIGIEVRKQAEDLSMKFIEGNNDVQSELARLEKTATLANPNGNKSRLERSRIGLTNIPERTAIISYFFTLNGALRAFVIEKGVPLRMVKLSMSEREADVFAESIKTKIRDRIFFKSDGKAIYDQLIAPLALDADHIIVVPDKSLWKIPFHALSPDGKSYLIEQQTISYSPSFSMLVEEFKKEVPVRKTIRVFANDSFENRHLPYVNSEATKIAGMFGTQAVISATRQKFLSSAGDSDILHFSMHAKADPDEPLESFLAFKAERASSGRISVEDLLSIRTKQKNLVFLASCETSSVLSGEGLVSIAWALLGSGSSSVISAQWEANDRSTEIFAEHFYTAYRQGNSLARSMQAAAVAMIRKKTAGSHEPYYWAAFTLLGDYR